MAYGPQFALPARRDQGTLKPLNEEIKTKNSTAASCYRGGDGTFPPRQQLAEVFFDNT